MAITSSCTGCGKTLAVADEFAGRQARCPACGQIYTVPESTASLGASPGYSNAHAPLDLGNPLGSSLGSPLGGTSGQATSSAAQSANPVSYWMRAPNGVEYGPADSDTLARWFREGRVGPDYQIKLGELGPWQPAVVYQPAQGPGGMPNAVNLGSAANPYASTAALAASAAGPRGYPKADQSGLVLAMGILSWIGCPIFGIIAWVVGAQALADIHSGSADPATRGLVQVGYYMGMINVILWVACGGLMFLFAALAAVA
ncbi:MAG: hypothetical protein IT423_04955 [Pirellulaceae bacterium]|nr:hypothetical protein [Pirellulaceae bacterium]